MCLTNLHGRGPCTAGIIIARASAGRSRQVCAQRFLLKGLKASHHCMRVGIIYPCYSILCGFTGDPMGSRLRLPHLSPYHDSPIGWGLKVFLRIQKSVVRHPSMYIPRPPCCPRCLLQDSPLT